MHRFLGGVLVVALVSLWPAPATADDATEAKLRFVRAVQLVEKNKLREALNEFFVSNRLSPNPSATFNIAGCLEAMGRLEDAYTTYQDYLQFPLTADDRQAADEALARILPKVARVRVVTDPPGAMIYLDRENLGQYGRSPRTLASSPGIHKVIVKLPGYHPATKEVVLVKGTEAQLDATLEPVTTKLKVITEPPGAEIRVDDPEGAVMGKTPATVEVPIGEHTILLSLAGYRLVRQPLILREGETPNDLSLELTARAAAQGQVRVLANVASAVVNIDGREQGFTPVVIESAVGDHELSVERHGYRPWTETVTISEAHPLAVDVTLRPRVSPGENVRWMMLWTTTAAAALGGVAGMMAVSAASKFEENPTQEGLDKTRTLNSTADALFGAATLGGIATAVSFFVDDDVHESVGKVTQPGTLKMGSGEEQP